MPTLVLIRHGQSTWNLENRFTGWWDVDLTEQGEEEARAAGRLLRHLSVRCPAALSALGSGCPHLLQACPPRAARRR